MVTASEGCRRIKYTIWFFYTTKTTKIQFMTNVKKNHFKNKIKKRKNDLGDFYVIII